MKKIITAIIIASMLVTGAYANGNDGTSAAATEIEYTLPEKVEISFKVGDDTLKINGEDVTTETAPYVVETQDGGVTLVPVRVITEAFGAKVGWEEATQTVTLDYPDVNIVLQIGNPVAEVNGEAVTLLTAPELPGGRTMVPLRFISENLGATVKYNDENAEITVVKENSDGGNTLEGAIENEFVGDSKMGWMMLNPVGYTMSSRYEDGTRTRFVDEDYNDITVRINKRTKDYDFEKEFKSLKKSEASYGVLSKADKNSENAELMTMHFVSRGSDYFYDTKVFVTSQYIYIVEVSVENENETAKADLVEISDSFSLKFEGDVHDLVKKADEESRKYESEIMGIKLMLPEFISNEPEGTLSSSFIFESKSYSDSEIKINVYSKDGSSFDSKTYLEYVKENVSRGANQELFTASEITSQKFGEIDAFVFDYAVEGSKHGTLDKTAKYVAFELGEYIYRLQIVVDSDDTPGDGCITEFLKKMEFKPIDADKVGSIIDTNEPDEENIRKVNMGKIDFDVPVYYSDYVSSTNTTMRLTDETREAEITVTSQILPLGYSAKNILAQSKLSYEELKYSNSERTVTVSDISETKLGDTVLYSFDVTIYVEEDLKSSAIYSEYTIYAFEKNGYAYVVNVDTNDLYVDAAREEAKAIISSMKEHTTENEEKKEN